MRFFKLDRHDAIGGRSVPGWMITASIAATILTLIPVATVGAESSFDHEGIFSAAALQPDPAVHGLRAMSYTVFSVLGVVDLAPVGC